MPSRHKSRPIRYLIPRVVGALLLVVVVGLVLFWPQSIIQDMREEDCARTLAQHALRFRVVNGYSDYIYINVDYTWGTAIPSETWGIKPGIGAVTVYTRNLFTIENNVTVTLTAYSSQSVTVLQEKPIKFSLLATRLVYDQNYHADIHATMTATENTSLECVSQYVFQGPLFVAGL